MGENNLPHYLITNSYMETTDDLPLGYSWTIDDLDETDILCPECKDNTTLRVGCFSYSPDDYYSVLFCPKCNYEEQE